MLSPPPPQISKPEINQHWLEITFKHVLRVTFMRVFARGLCVHSYVEIKEHIHNSRLSILFRPPQVVTCSSASGDYLHKHACRLALVCPLCIANMESCAGHVVLLCCVAMHEMVQIANTHDCDLCNTGVGTIFSFGGTSPKVFGLCPRVSFENLCLLVLLEVPALTMSRALSSL